jgi:hypothetical protein
LQASPAAEDRCCRLEARQLAAVLVGQRSDPGIQSPATMADEAEVELRRIQRVLVRPLNYAEIIPLLLRLERYESRAAWPQDKGIAAFVR